jgi:serine/threonine protein kinase
MFQVSVVRADIWLLRCISIARAAIYHNVNQDNTHGNLEVTEPGRLKIVSDRKSNSNIHDKPVYSYSVDWFSLGCCIYEFLIGESPFRTDQAKNWGRFRKTKSSGPFFSLKQGQNAENEQDENLDTALQEMGPDLDRLEEYRLRMSYEEKKCQELSSTMSTKNYNFDDHNMSKRHYDWQGNDVIVGGNIETKEADQLLDDDFNNVKDLLRKLLQKDPADRLGSGGCRCGCDPLGYREIQSHPWFASIDWNSLDKVVPPFIPPAYRSNDNLGSEIGEFEDEDVVNRAVKFVDQSIYSSWYYISLGDAEEVIVELLIHRDKNKV